MALMFYLFPEVMILFHCYGNISNHVFSKNPSPHFPFFPPSCPALVLFKLRDLLFTCVVWLRGRVGAPFYGAEVLR